MTVIALHPLACTGPTGSDGCVCGRSSALPVSVRWQIGDHVTSAGVDGFLDNLESLIIALGQRKLTLDQIERFARLLQAGEQTAVGALAANRKRR